MKGSLIIVGFFALGVACGLADVLPDLSQTDISFYALCALMFCVGISVGSDPQTLNSFRALSPRLALLPVATILGTLAGTAIISLLLQGRTLADCLAVGSGTGHRGPAGQHLPRNHHPAGCTLACQMVRSPRPHLRRGRNNNGHHPAHHYPHVGATICGGVHIPRIPGRLQRAFPRHAVVLPLIL